MSSTWVDHSWILKMNLHLVAVFREKWVEILPPWRVMLPPECPDKDIATCISASTAGPFVHLERSTVIHLSLLKNFI